jgi:nitric oxide reductase activation protein
LRFKEFNQPFDDTVLGRLDRVEGALSTRMGAAIRHAHTCLRDCRTAQQLILLVTDGEPHDIDVFHPGVLMHDAAHAVAHATAAGSPVFCVSVDPKADDYIRRIFGLHHYLVIENVEQLPQRLPELYLRLTA